MVNMRRFITPLLRLITSIFFRRIEIVGWEKVPPGPVIFAVNHPNGHIDPLFLTLEASLGALKPYSSVQGQHGFQPAGNLSSARSAHER